MIKIYKLSRKNLSVLLLDDNAQIKASFRQLFESIFRHTYLVECSNETELFQVLNNQHFDLVVIDSRLYGKSGLEAVRMVKEHYPKIKVIGLYASANDPFKELILTAGADAIISKFEVRPRILKKQLKRMLL